MKTSNPYLPKKVKILSVTKETNDISTFRLDYPVKNKPGQFVEVGVLGIGECPISFCSYSNKHIDLCIRNVGNVTNAIHHKTKNDYVVVRGPFGNGYPLEQMFGNELVLIGGGTGAAPMRSVIDYVEQNRKKFGKVSIFFGFRNYENILFKKDFKKWSKLFNFQFTLDCPPNNIKLSKLKCNTGAVTSLLEKAEFSENAKALICGPPIMLKFIIPVLMAKGIKEQNVFISFERLMSCGIGKCGHCELNGKYVCKHGPVFRYDEAKNFTD